MTLTDRVLTYSDVDVSRRLTAYVAPRDSEQRHDVRLSGRQTAHVYLPRGRFVNGAISRAVTAGLPVRQVPSKDQ